MENESVIWRPIVIDTISENYEVSDRGDIRNIVTKVLCNVYRYETSRPKVGLKRLNGTYATVAVLKCVSIAFKPAEAGLYWKPYEINGDRNDLRVENIGWTETGTTGLRSHHAALAISNPGKPCSKCGGPRTNLKHSWCNVCLLKRFKTWRANNLELARESSKESHARQKVGEQRRCVRVVDLKKRYKSPKLRLREKLKRKEDAKLKEMQVKEMQVKARMTPILP